MSSGDAARPVAQKGAQYGRALRFVLLLGMVGLFADMTYEGARSINGPYLAVLGASAAAVGIIAGSGELVGYGLRLVSGRLADRTGKYWAVVLFGYFLQIPTIPLLALAGRWEVAAVLIILERAGKAMRNPPRDVMLSHATTEMGRGWGFGVHEVLDQTGALIGPLIASAVLAARGEYTSAYALFAIPACCCLALITTARFVYPRPRDLEPNLPDVQSEGLPQVYWLYVAGAALVGAGFADFSLVAYHFQTAATVSPTWIPVFYAIAMAVAGAGSLIFGRLFDRVGIVVLIPLTIMSALFAPLVFLGGFALALIGAALWGLGIGVQDSIMAAAVANMVPANRRGSAYGIFNLGYGVFWFLGSALMGILYGVSILWVVAFAVVVQLAALPLFVLVRHESVQAQS